MKAAPVTLATDLPFGCPETPIQLRSAFNEIHNAVQPLAGSYDPETLSEVVWSSLHGLASLARAGRLRPDFHEKRMAILIDLLKRTRLRTAPFGRSNVVILGPSIRVR
jgi:hypothetical protein